MLYILFLSIEARPVPKMKSIVLIEYSDPDNLALYH
jgi:hypothetical protein